MNKRTPGFSYLDLLKVESKEKTFKDDIIAVSFHEVVKGKPQAVEELVEIDGRQVKKKILYQNGHKVNLGYGWNNMRISVEQFFRKLTVEGYAMGPFLRSDHRDAKNFVSHSFALVDIDNGMSLTELDSMPFYLEFGAGFYTTASHTPEAPRFRIIYRLEERIKDAEEMRQLYEGLLALHGAADISCKDPARLFYGTKNAQQSKLRPNVLTQQGILQALQAREISLKSNKVVPQSNVVIHAPPSLAEVQQHLDELRKHVPNLPYLTRFKVTRAVASSIGEQAAVIEMRTRWNDTDKTASYEDLLRDPLQPDGPTIGSIIKMIRDINPNYMKPQIKPIKKAFSGYSAAKMF
jgi:hypothetical protein